MATAKKFKPMSARIREFQLKHPKMSAIAIAKALNTTADYVYGVRHKDKGKHKMVRITTSNKPLQSVTMSVDNMTNMTDEQAARLAYNLGKPRIRMQGAPLAVSKRWEEQSVIQEDKPTDNVNQPAHYKVGGIETIDFIEAKQLNYHLGNVVKYITRADSKGNREEDLLKARWYLNREIAKFAK